jgi:ubiquinone/menaquinone biosynthesis C-methylase UbiE
MGTETVRRYLKKVYEKVVPVQWITPQIFDIKKFIKFASKKVNANDRLLDIGAGQSLWKDLFSQANYISMDNLTVDEHLAIDVVGDACAIPFKNSSINAILCLSLLEHLQDPTAVLEECFRVLVSQGSLFITVPFGIGLHMRPHDYYRFTEYGLRYLLEKAGFTVIFIQPLSGHFAFIGDQFRVVALELSRSNPLRNLPLLFLFGVIIPGLCFYADKLDKKRRFSQCYRTSTLGYSCYSIRSA